MDPRWTATVRLNLRPLSGAYEHAPHIVGAFKESSPMKVFFAPHTVAAKLIAFFRARPDRVTSDQPSFWILHAR
jgi:hypothetical protein